MSDTPVTADASLESTFALLKPDAVERKLVGEIIARMERAGLELIAARMLTPSRPLAEKHYGEEIAQRYGAAVREALLEYLCAGPCLATVWRGPDAVARMRQTIGRSPQPVDCAPGTIRHDLGSDSVVKANTERRALKNLVHASDARQSAESEIQLWGMLDGG